MLLALVELIRMLKRRASKRFVLVESGEDNANGSGQARDQERARAPLYPNLLPWIVARTRPITMPTR